MESTDDQAVRIRKDLIAEVRAIRIFSTSVIFSAAAVASSTVLLIIPNLETLSLFFFLVGYRYGMATGATTVITSVTLYEMFASQIYGTGGIIPFLLKFPPFILIMMAGVYFHASKVKDELSTEDEITSSAIFSQNEVTVSQSKILYRPTSINHKIKEINFSLYERFLLIQLGLALTIIYDVVTTFGILVYVPTWEGLFVSFIMGIPFFAFHQVTNALLFSTIPSIIVALDKARPMV